MKAIAANRLVVALSLFAIGAATVPEFEINLDSPAERRFIDVYKYYYDSGLLVSMRAAELAGKIPTIPVEKKQRWLKVLEPLLDQETLAEADGIVQYLKSRDPDNYLNVSMQKMMLVQAGYEENYPSFCSGTLAAMRNGTTVHSRNMDYPLRFKHKGGYVGWPELTTNLVFMRSGKPLYTMVHWPLLLGLHTGMRFDGWSFEQNTRRTGNDVELNLEAAAKGGMPFAVTARRIMERVPDFETAVRTLNEETKFMSSHYFIMAGKKPYEGVSLNIARMGAHLKDASDAPRRLSDATWSLVQTNDDAGKMPLDSRRPIAEHLLRTANRDQVSPKWAADFERAPPLFNSGTVFTWIAVPATNYYKLLLAGDSTDDIPDVQKAPTLSLLAKAKRKAVRGAPLHHEDMPMKAV